MCKLCFGRIDSRDCVNHALSSQAGCSIGLPGIIPAGRPALSAVVILLALAAAAPAQDMRRVYERAEKFLPASASSLVLNLAVEPAWVDGTDRFVYRRQLPGGGRQFVLVDPALTVQLIDALTKANKDYDLIVMPNKNHAFASDPYFNRRRWDYFVRHLLGAEPPQGYELKAVIPPSP